MDKSKPKKIALEQNVENEDDTVSSMCFQDIIRQVKKQTGISDFPAVIGENSLGMPFVFSIEKSPRTFVFSRDYFDIRNFIDKVIVSTIYCADPNYNKLILVDTYISELRMYNCLPHMLVPTVKDDMYLQSVMKWLISEMDRRYYVLSLFRVKSFNELYHVITSKMVFEKSLQRITIIINDCSNEFWQQQDFQEDLLKIISHGEALGIHIILATSVLNLKWIQKLLATRTYSTILFQSALNSPVNKILNMVPPENISPSDDFIVRFEKSSEVKAIHSYEISQKEIEYALSFIKQKES